jgi:virginiamycin B lyase
MTMMANKDRTATLFPAALTVASCLLLGWTTGAVAQQITEFPIPTSNSGPEGITAGSDGAVWFTEKTKIGRITTAGVVTEFPLPPDPSLPVGVQLEPTGIAAGPDGALWFTLQGANKLGRITTGGTITEFSVPTGSSRPTVITAGPDGALWFAESAHQSIGRITTNGVITEFAAGAFPIGIAQGPDGALWFTGTNALNPHGGIGRMTTSGTVTAFTGSAAVRGAAAFFPSEITAGPDGALWFLNGDNLIGRISTQATINLFSLSPGVSATGITAGPDGALWFGQTGGVGRITTSGIPTLFTVNVNHNLQVVIRALVPGPDGAVWFTDAGISDLGAGTIGQIIPPASTSPLFSAVLPSSRSVQTGNTATAFATIINSGSTAASGCAIVPVTPVPASFVYQTTNPATNALTGSPNTPASIAAGASQSFVIAFTANAPFVPTNVVLGFDCSGVNAAPSNTGLNTLLLSASATPVPDVVALAATAQNDGILHITGTTGSNAFAVATVNVGASASITATASTGAATLPLAISLCQTNPTSGQCISSVGPSVTTTINANATPTFAIFATASGTVPFVPQTNRIFVEFSDANGTVRGSTSVAVQTQ